ncbi:hypothetical protein BAY61_01130 [Prauserella marina]|uniref:Uncharacterized protein n=1 Tax=Prauserella marina TaxID=530584 RepID=A0A222VIR8_9PSEU|nr:hypothetical protein [Prauserella marina]ASR33819.1 hypothetical protein BAY61_01130 [Prauserella marina]PWV82401.1 hypothetical protein DES30_102642 [Prauserella marina]SDC68296.1 hypothetical protein SAMN05421630_103178 [Prauserella marina]
MSSQFSVNTGFAEIQAAGERLATLASEYAESAGKIRGELEDKMTPAVYGSDKPGSHMTSNLPDLELLYGGQRDLGNQGSDIGGTIQTVMSELENVDNGDRDEMGGVQA